MLTCKRTANTFGGTVTKRQYFFPNRIVKTISMSHKKKVRTFPMLCFVGFDHMETTAFHSNWDPMGPIVVFDRN